MVVWCCCIVGANIYLTAHPLPRLYSTHSPLVVVLKRRASDCPFELTRSNHTVYIAPYRQQPTDVDHESNSCRQLTRQAGGSLLFADIQIFLRTVSVRPVKQRYVDANHLIAIRRELIVVKKIITIQLVFVLHRKMSCGLRSFDHTMLTGTTWDDATSYGVSI